MPESESNRIARLEERYHGVREDMHDMAQEIERHRGRLHNLEGIAQTFVDTQQTNRRREAEQYERLSTRLTLVGLVLAACAILSPILVAVTTSR